MIRLIAKLLFIVWVVLVGCSERDKTNSQAVSVTTTASKKTNDMKNMISIVEIPTVDFSRAKNFYETILGIRIEVVEMEGMKIGLFPNADTGLVIQLIQAEGYRPSVDGTIVYLNGGDDLQKIEDKIKVSKGMILIPKTEIGPEMGFYSIFTDTEGNKMGLYSVR